MHYPGLSVALLLAAAAIATSQEANCPNGYIPQPGKRENCVPFQLQRRELEYQAGTRCPIEYTAAVNDPRSRDGYTICILGNIAACEPGSRWYAKNGNNRCQQCDCQQGGAAKCNKIDCSYLDETILTPDPKQRGSSLYGSPGRKYSKRRGRPDYDCKPGCTFLVRDERRYFCDCEGKVDVNSWKE